jgi:predicted nucleic acid-binding protein
MMVNLTKFPRGVSVFVDANILVYYFTQLPPLTEACKAFFERVSRLEIKAFTSAHVAADVIHRIMLAEAIATLGLASRDAVSYLKSHPDAVKQLEWYRAIPSDIA